MENVNAEIVTYNVVHHAKNTSEKLGIPFIDGHNAEKSGKPFVYLIGAYFLAQPEIIRYIDRCKSWGKKMIIHWIGSDISDMFALSKEEKRKWADYFNQDFILNLTEATYTSNELEELGIHNSICPIPMKYYPENQDVPPLRTDKTSIAIYMYGRPDFYHWDIGLDLMKNDITKGWEFHVFGIRDEYKETFHRPSFENVFYYETVDVLKEIVPKTNVLLRLTEHDGLPLGVIEFMMMKRFVVFNNPHIIGVNYVEPNIKSVSRELAFLDAKIKCSKEEVLDEELETHRDYWMRAVGVDETKKRLNAIVENKFNTPIYERN